MGKKCWSQVVLESGSWGHSVLQIPALDIIIIYYYYDYYYYHYYFYTGNVCVERVTW